MRQWRLIYDSPTIGAENMAIDEAILASISAGKTAPTLRLYGWQPPCLSLGYGQHVRDVDLERLAVNGWELVRRPTGGKAILHVDELTYSVALPIHHPLARGGVIESYLRISEALAAGLRRLGVKPYAEQNANGGQMSVVCFETPSHYELMVNGKKLVGSAQARRKEGVLQHGSLPLCGDITRICDVLRYKNEAEREKAKRKVRARATTLEEALTGQRIGWQAAAEAVTCGFEETLNAEFKIGELTDEEREQAAKFREAIYANVAWTWRR
jgi:lipoate-protein ligase A